MMKILGVAIGVACCVAVITAFPMYGPKTLPIFPQPRNLGKGFGGAFCPTHGSFDGGHQMGFDASIHGDRFNPLGLVGYYGQYKNINDNIGIIPSAGRQGISSFRGPNNDFNNDLFDNNRDFNNFDSNRGFDNFDNNRGFDNFDDNNRGFDNFDDNNRGFDNFDNNRGFDNFDDNNRGFDNFDDNNRGFDNFDNNRGFDNFDDNNRGFDNFDNGFPAGPIQRNAFPRGPIGGGPLDNFENDMGFIQDQISHKK